MLNAEAIKNCAHPSVVADSLREYGVNRIPEEINQACEDFLLKIKDEIQNACNAVAVAKALHDVGRILYGLGYDSVGTRNHIAFRSIIGKLCDLSAIEHSFSDAYLERK